MLNPSEQPFARRLPAIVAVTAACVLLPMDVSMVPVALPSIARALHVSQSDTVLLVSIYNLVLAMSLLPLAALGERTGLRRMFLSGMLVYAAASATCLVAQNINMLLVLRAFQALGAAAVLSVVIALVRALYPPHQLGRGLGFNTIAGSSGAALGPVVSGLVLSVAPWQAVFLVGVPLAVLALALGQTLPTIEPRRSKFDTKGALLCAATFGLLVGGLESFTQHLPLMATGAILAVGCIVATIFVRHERTEDNPILPVDLLVQPRLALSVAAGFSTTLATGMMVLAVPFRFNELGFGPAEIGAMIAPYAISSMIVAPASGMLSDRFSPATLGTFGLSFATLGLTALAFLPEDPTYLSVAWRMVLCGLGLGMFFAPNARLIVGSVPLTRAASASSLLSTIRSVGGALGASLFGVLLTINGLGVRPALFIAVGFCIIGLLGSIARQRLPQPTES